MENIHRTKVSMENIRRKKVNDISDVHCSSKENQDFGGLKYIKHPAQVIDSLSNEKC